jgi:tripartite-type tricarboxylate transporter receptor subunit TctC
MQRSITRRQTGRALVAAAAVLGASALFAADANPPGAWPVKPLRAVIAYPPAGGVDLAARIVGQRLAERLGQPVVPDNQPGAIGTIAASFVARAAPDGYTLLAATNPELTIAQHLRKSLPYNPSTDLVPLLRTAQAPVVLVVRASDAANADARALIDRARAAPDRIAYATPGVGTPMHLIMEGIAKASGVRFNHIPYNGGARAMADLIGGQVDALAITLPTVAAQMQSGTLKAVAVLQTERSALLPEVPTWKEASGVEILDLPTIWFAWFAPARTAPAVRARLSTELAAVMQEPAVQDALRRAGLEPKPLPPAPFLRQLESESAFFERTARPYAER